MNALTAPDLHTERLRLRALDERDAAALMKLFTDPDVLRYWSHRAWTDRAQALEMLSADRQAQARATALRLGLERAEGGPLIGTLSLFNLSWPNRRGEIGYALRREYWGRGLMHEALRCFMDYLFNALALHRLEADIDPRNAASARSVERLGFQREGLLRERWIVANEVSDSALYGLLASDWRMRDGAFKNTLGA